MSSWHSHSVSAEGDKSVSSGMSESRNVSGTAAGCGQEAAWVSGLNLRFLAEQHVVPQDFMDRLGSYWNCHMLHC